MYENPGIYYLKDGRKINVDAETIELASIPATDPITYVEKTVLFDAVNSEGQAN